MLQSHGNEFPNQTLSALIQGKSTIDDVVEETNRIPEIIMNHRKWIVRSNHIERQMKIVNHFQKVAGERNYLYIPNVIRLCIIF